MYKKSLQKIEELAISLNESKKRHECDTVLNELSQVLKGEYNIKQNQSREFIREYKAKISFLSKKTLSGDYKVYVFNDMIAITDVKSKTSLIFFIVFIKISDYIKQTINEIKLQVLYKNSIEVLTVIFHDRSVCRDFHKTVMDLMNKQILFLLKNGVNEEFIVKGLNRGISIGKYNCLINNRKYKE